MHTTFMDTPAVDSDGMVASLSLNSTHLVYHVSDTCQGRTTSIRPPVGDVQLNHLMDTASLWGMYTYTIVTICGQTLKSTKHAVGFWRLVLPLVSRGYLFIEDNKFSGN